MLRNVVFSAAETLAPFLAEFLGTFFVAVTVGLSALSGDPDWEPISIAFAVMVSMYATAATSGGHLSPAISIAMGLARKMEMNRVLAYCLVQTAGGLVGGSLVKHFMATNQLGWPLVVRPGSGFDMLDVLIVEGVFSVAICTAALHCIASSRNNPEAEPNQFWAMAVGFVILAGVTSTKTISGGWLNPAITLGYGLTGQDVNLHWSLMYVGIQVGAALLATMLFWTLRPEELNSLGITSLRGSLSALCCCRDSKHTDSEAALVDEALTIDDYAPPLPARLLGEFLGTYVVAMTFGLSWAASEAGVQVGASPRRVVSGGTTTPWATGAAVTAMTYSLSNVSGGMFNPAVALAAVVSGRGRSPFMDCLPIMACQVGAGVAAAITYGAITRGHEKLKGLELGPGHGHAWGELKYTEAFFTMVVALVVLCMTTVKSPRYPRAPCSKSFPFALAIGMCVAAAGFGAEGTSGGVMNPAITVGISVFDLLFSGVSQRTWTSQSLVGLSYVLWQMLGGLSAGVLFVALHPLEYKRDPLLAA